MKKLTKLYYLIQEIAYEQENGISDDIKEGTEELFLILKNNDELLKKVCEGVLSTYDILDKIYDDLF